MDLPIDDANRPTLRDLVTRFESLGGGSPNPDGWTFGCAFGFFQRHARAEPLGLLRWASSAPEDPIRSLKAGFDRGTRPGGDGMRSVGRRRGLHGDAVAAARHRRPDSQSFR